MLSVTDLLTIQTKPKEKDISLQIIQEFYKEHLCDRLFTFELDDPDRPIIRLRFEKGNLCHLLGIQYVVKNIRNKHEYIGKKGYKKLEDGTLTFDFLRRTNNKWFKSKRNRMLYFPFVYQILHNPNAIIFDTKLVSTRIDVDIILYNHLDNTYLHLGIDKDKDSDYYYPKSFYDRKRDDHIVNQKQVKVKSIKVEID